MAIIITVAALGLHVLLAAGSNKSVDNLAVAAIKTLDMFPIPSTWCGKLVRARTTGCQISLVRAQGSIWELPDYHLHQSSQADVMLDPYQLPRLVEVYANDPDNREGNHRHH